MLRHLVINLRCTLLIITYFIIKQGKLFFPVVPDQEIQPIFSILSVYDNVICFFIGNFLVNVYIAFLIVPDQPYTSIFLCIIEAYNNTITFTANNIQNDSLVYIYKRIAINYWVGQMN